MENYARLVLLECEYSKVEDNSILWKQIMSKQLRKAKLLNLKTRELIDVELQV